MTPADWVSGSIALLSCAVAVLAWIGSRKANKIAAKANDHAKRANAIAKSALEDARQARVDVAWDEAIRSLNELVTFDFAGASEPVGSRLVAARTSLLMLSDKLSGESVANWLHAAWSVAALLIREAGETRVDKSSPEYVNEVLAANARAATWLTAMIQNLRVARRDGIPEEVAARLEHDAHEVAESVRRRNGWSEETSIRDALKPL